MSPPTTKIRDRHTVGVEPCGVDRVAKSFPPDTLGDECDKARAMETALAGSPFRAPRVFNCDEGTGRIEFEFFPNSVLLQEIIEKAYHSREFRRAMKLNDAAAALLSTLHKRLTLPQPRNWQAPEILSRRLALDKGCVDDVCLHCDFSAVNLLVTPQEELIVIDASPNHYFTRSANLTGSALVDIATYTVRLIWPFRRRAYTPRWRAMAGALRRRFVRGYERASGWTIDRQQLADFEQAALRCFIEHKTRQPLVRWAATNLGRAAIRFPAIPPYIER